MPNPVIQDQLMTRLAMCHCHWHCTGWVGKLLRIIFSEFSSCTCLVRGSCCRQGVRVIVRRTVATDKVFTAHVRVARYARNFKSLSATRANPSPTFIRASLELRKRHEENTLHLWFARISRIVATRAIAAMLCANHDD